MKLIGWAVFIVIAVVGQNATTEAPTVEVTPPTTTVASDPPRLRSKATTSTTSTTTAPNTTTTTTTVPVLGIDTARYPDLWITAIEVGWPVEWLPTLDEIMYRESRGQTGLTGNGAVGLTQVQWSVWHETATELGYTKQQVRDEVAPNLTVALTIAYIAVDYYDRWCQPWYMSLKKPSKYC